MIAFFFVCGNGSTREEVTRIRSLVRLRVKLINKRKKKIYDWSRHVVWGKSLNNKNNFLLREQDDSKTRKKRKRGTERARERKKGVACRHGMDMDIYLAFEESYLPTYGNTHTRRRLERICYNQ